MEALWQDVLVNVYCLIHILRSCTGDASMVLLTSKRIVTHYKIYMNDVYDPSDTPDVLRPEECKALCDKVINARHFANRYHEKYYTTHEEIEFRFNPVQHSEFSGSGVEIQDCLTQQRQCRRRVKCLQCASSENINWFVTFSQLHPFMYLLEQRADLKRPIFRTVGLFEPSAIIEHDYKSFLYFYHLTVRRKSKMEEVCRIGVEDRLRLCSVIFNALNEMNTMRTINLKIHRQCMRSIVRGKRLSAKMNVLPCTVDEESVLLPFKQLFLLADPEEQGAVYVLWNKTKENVRNVIVLSIFGRATQAGALLHPIPVKEKKKNIVKGKNRAQSDEKNIKKRKISEVLKSDADSVEEESSSKTAVADKECEEESTGTMQEEADTKDTSTSSEYEEESDSDDDNVDK